MKKFCLAFAGGIVIFVFASIGLANQAPTGPYKVIKTVKIGGDGGFDYVSADVEGRRLYVPRNGPMGRVTVYDLDTLAPVGEIPNVSSGGAIVDPKSHHGFSTTKPITMWDTNTLAVIKTINVEGRPDGILFDPYNERVWILSHAAPYATVIDGRDGTVVGTIDLGGAPEQAASDGKGTVYVNISDQSNIAVVDAKTLMVTAHYDLSSKATRSSGLCLDTKNRILFSYLHAPSSMAVVVNADNGNIITTLPTGDGVDTVAFNPNTMEAISTNGTSGSMTIIKENSPTDFVVEQTLPTLPGARTMALDTKMNRMVTMTGEFGPPPPPPPGGGRGGRAPMIPGSFTLIQVGK
jgi:hypothetical protein